MDISGNQKVRTNRQQVFQALLDPEVLKNSIPGCEKAEFVEFPTGRQLKLIVSPNLPGFKGPYNIFLQTGELVPPSRIVMIAEPSSSFGSVKATCVIELADDAESTQLSYHASAEVSGKIAGVPDIAINTAVKIGLGQFFKNFEKQVSAARV
jgi:carbon monoxide dehydrogenase subunit G